MSGPRSEPKNEPPFTRPISDQPKPGGAHSDASYLAPARNVLVLADNPISALDAPPRYSFWITADLGYRYWYDGGFFMRMAREQGRIVRAWCDCDATPAEEAIKFAHDYGLNGWAGQAESADQFDRAYAAGARLMVGNLSALRPDQLARVASGEVLFVHETYFNKQPDLVVDWRNANKGVGGNCVAVYGSADEGAVYTSLADHIRDGRFNPHIDSVYAPGMQPTDWATLKGA